MKTIYDSIDWLSVKLNTPGAVMLFITVGDVIKILGAASIASTLIYNGIRIYKELKNKNKP